MEGCEEVAVDGGSRGAEGVVGWEMEFWPVITVPSRRPALMWCVKFVFMAGRTDVCSGTLQMELRR